MIMFLTSIAKLEMACMGYIQGGADENAAFEGGLGKPFQSIGIPEISWKLLPLKPWRC